MGAHARPRPRRWHQHQQQQQRGRLALALCLTAVACMRAARAAATPPTRRANDDADNNTSSNNPSGSSSNNANSPWSPDSFPNPAKDPAACGRAAVAGAGGASAVCDPDGLLSRAGADVVEGLLAAIRAGAAPYARSPCASRQERRQGTGGYQVAAAVVARMAPEIGGVGEGDAAGRARAFARQLHDAWGVGRDAAAAAAASGDCAPDGGDGALIFLSVDDRQAFISTGAQAARRLPDRTLAAILRAMRAPLRRADYDAALAQAAADVGLALAGRLDPSDFPGGDGDGGEDGDDDGWGMFAFFAAIFAAVFGGSWWSDRRGRARLDACRAKLEAIRREHQRRAAAQAAGGAGGAAGGGPREYGASPTCPVCLEPYEGQEGAAAEAEALAAGGGGGGGGGGSAAVAEAGGSGSSAATAPLASAPAEPAPKHHQQPAPSSWAATAAAAAAAAAEAASGGHHQHAAHPPRRKLVLPCGHAACEPCLQSWMGEHARSSCPICRVDVGAPPPSQQQGSSTEQRDAASAAAAANAANAAAAAYPSPSYAAADALWYPEVAFRLRRLRHLYPDYVSHSMLTQWERDAIYGRPELFDPLSGREGASLRRYESRDPGRAREYERMGSGGAVGGGFGGGGGRGGGGMGTSW